MTNATDALLPCPFCGKPPLVLPRDPASEGDSWTRITCDNRRCGATAAAESFAERGHFAAAAKKWNRRADAGEPREVLDSYADRVAALDAAGAAPEGQS